MAGRTSEFSYSSAFQIPEIINTYDGGFSPKTGDFSIKPPQKTFFSSTELELLTPNERRAYQMRWGMKGHPLLNAMLAPVLGCPELEIPHQMEIISLKVRFHNRLSLN